MPLDYQFLFTMIIEFDHTLLFQFLIMKQAITFPIQVYWFNPLEIPRDY